MAKPGVTAAVFAVFIGSAGVAYAAMVALAVMLELDRAATSWDA